MLSFILIGSIIKVLEDMIFAPTKFVLSLPYGISSFLIGSLHQIITVTGMHHIFNLLEIQLLLNLGVNPFNPIISCTIADKLELAKE